MLSEYFHNLADLVEETFSLNGGRRVVLVSHSLGSLMTLYFLQHRDQQWKDRHIETWISAAGLWGGTAMELEVRTSFYNVG